MRKLLTGAIVALGLTTAPLAQAAAPARASAPIAAGDNRLAGEPSTPLIMALIIAAASIYLLVTQDDHDRSDSP